MCGALNVVLRTDLDGVEARAVARKPSKDGGDGWQGSAFWGGAVGEGDSPHVPTRLLALQSLAELSSDEETHAPLVRAGGWPVM